MVNCLKRSIKPVVRYTNVPEERINKTQRGMSKIPVENVHVYSPVLASEEAEFTKILGGKIDAAFYSLFSTVSYKPSTPPSKLPTFHNCKEEGRNNKSKAAITTPTDKTNEPVPSLTNILQNLNKGEVRSTSVVVQEDIQGSYIEMFAFLCWERISILQFRGPVVMWSTLMLALENPYVISTKRLKLCLQDFSFNGVYLTDNQISCAFELLELIFAAWSDPQSAVGLVPLWHGSDSHKYQLQQAMGTILELLSYSHAGSRQSMALVGNLVLSGSKVSYCQRLHHMPKYIEWLLGVMYLVGGKTLKEYAQQESLLWECILLGLAFPYSIGVNHVNFLPVDDYPFLPFAFCWLSNVWIIYAAIAKVLIQLRLGLEAIVSQ
ncbi:hypothetical protein DSO57_1000140 [Entomophthora muscae]|uniref:Uncharacterized protein n=1 Tax=Entomophthora muscae TaxID=34485 RepID=A0ACC2T993_9FUNG|nr:hypothetical protein DSO57_1000140 [Entomophthora muscae]